MFGLFKKKICLNLCSYCEKCLCNTLMENIYLHSKRLNVKIQIDVDETWKDFRKDYEKFINSKIDIGKLKKAMSEKKCLYCSITSLSLKNEMERGIMIEFVNKYFENLEKFENNTSK